MTHLAERVKDLELPTGRRAALLLGGTVVLAFGVPALIGNFADYDEVVDGMKKANGQWFPLLLGGEVVAFLGYVMAYRGTARVQDGPRFGFWLTARLVAMSQGGVVIATGAGGLAVDYWALRRAGEAPPRAAARVLAFNTLEWAVLGAGAAIAAATELAGLGGDAAWELELAWICAVPACYVGGALVSSPGRVARLKGAGGGRIRAVSALVVEAVALVRAILSRPLRHPEPLLGAALYWGGLITCLWGSLRAFDIEIELAALVLGFATGYAATMLPLPAGGAGGVDAAMTFALTLVGVDLAPALVAVVAYRFFTFWLPLLPAVLAGATLRGVRERLPQARALTSSDPAA
jgi:uncharacterized membrane protein YbhN (UPF0104 family)